MARDYGKEYRTYQGTPEQIKNRAARNAARRKVKSEKEIPVGHDVHHVDGNPKNNKKANLKCIPKGKNRAMK